MQRTLVILKPDAVGRGLAGRLLARLEEKGLAPVGMKMMRMSRELAEEHYSQHRDKDFFEPLVRFMTSAPSIFIVVEGKGAVAMVRKLMGPTFGPDAPPGTIRGDFGVSRRFNLIHGSDSPESAEREIGLFFTPEELVPWTPSRIDLLYDTTGEELV